MHHAGQGAYATVHACKHNPNAVDAADPNNGSQHGGQQVALDVALQQAGASSTGTTRVAVKRIKQDADATVSRMLCHEAEVLSKLKHRWVCWMGARRAVGTCRMGVPRVGIPNLLLGYNVAVCVCSVTYSLFNFLCVE